MTEAAYAAMQPFLEKMKTDESLRRRLAQPAVVAEFREIEAWYGFWIASPC